MEASSRCYYSVNTSVNTAADVFRKARISLVCLLILVIPATYTPDALNVPRRCAAGSSGNMRRRASSPVSRSSTVRNSEQES